MAGSTRSFKLEVKDASGAITTRSIGPGSLTIGRALENDLTLPSYSLSRNHARIDLTENGKLGITDLNSKNGVTVNGKRITPDRLAPLAAGDFLDICGFALRIIDATNDGLGDRGPYGEPLGGATNPLMRSMAIDVADAREIRSTLIGAGGNREDKAAARDIPVADILSAAIDLMGKQEIAEVREAVLDFVGTIVGFDAGFLLSWDEDEMRFAIESERNAKNSNNNPAISRSIVGDAARSRKPVLLIDTATDDRYDATHSIIGMGIRSAIAAPLVADDETVLAIIYVTRLGGAHRYTQTDGRVLAYVAAIAALRFQNARLTEEAMRSRFLEGELSVAARIQMDLLPSSLPELDGYEIHGVYDPCRITSGDFYDFIKLADGKLALALGDVSGKGVGAAMLMFSAVTVLRTLLLDLDEGRSFEGLMFRANNALSATMATGRFATALAGTLDPATGAFVYSNAGQCAFIVRSNGDTLVLAGHGTPLGLFEDMPYGQTAVELAPGDILCLYSDGVSEARAPDRSFFGDERLRETLRVNRMQSAAEIARTIQAAVDAHVQHEPQADDSTFVILKRVRS